MKRSMILGGVLGAALLTGGGAAQAQSIIRNNEPHPHFEVDVHGTLATGFFGGYGYGFSYGVGGGFRLGIPIVPSGFLSRVNDSFALSVGADMVYLPYYGFYAGGEFIGHVDAQWNFYLTEKWSLFAEVGVAPRVYFGTGVCNGCWFGGFGEWIDFAVGARYHFHGGSQYPALTMRAGFTGFNIGVSF